jgi:hypothetical protein
MNGTSNVPPVIVKFPPRLRPVPKSDCQGEVRKVSLRSPVMNQILRSVGVDPAEWWVEQGRSMFKQALRDIDANGGRPLVREILLQALEEYQI